MAISKGGSISLNLPTQVTWRILGKSSVIDPQQRRVLTLFLSRDNGANYYAIGQAATRGAAASVLSSLNLQPATYLWRALLDTDPPGGELSEPALIDEVKKEPQGSAYYFSFAGDFGGTESGAFGVFSLFKSFEFSATCNSSEEMVSQSGDLSASQMVIAQANANGEPVEPGLLTPVAIYRGLKGGGGRGDTVRMQLQLTGGRIHRLSLNTVNSNPQTSLSSSVHVTARA